MMPGLGSDNSLSDEAHKRQRAHHKKSSKGCGTCKERHVKCDERRPTCQRCEGGGRECKGYDIAPKRRVQPFTVKGFKMVSFGMPETSPEEDMDATPTDEEVAQEFFRKNTLSVLQHTHPSRLWDVTTPRLIETFPALSQIAAAIGACHLRLTQPGAASSWDDKALAWYSKAVGSLSKAISSERRDATAIALASLFCILFDSMKRRKSEMLIHLHNGVRYVFEDTDFIIGEENRDIAGLLLRIGVASMMHDALHSEARETQEIIRRLRQRISVSVGKLDQENMHIDFSVVFGDTFEYLRRLKHGLYKDDDAQEAAQQELCERLEELITLAEQTPTDLTSLCVEYWQSHQALVLSHTIVCWVYVKACTAGYQTSYDRYNETFRRMTDLVEKSLKYANVHPEAIAAGRLVFSFGLAHSITLFSIAHQCRLPEIRHRALGLLKLCPARDGLWDAEERYKIAEAIIKHEEDASAALGEDRSCNVIPEECRVHNFDCIREDDGRLLAVSLLIKPRRDRPFETKTVQIG